MVMITTREGGDGPIAMARTQPTSADEGKRVVAANNEAVGTVSEVTEDTIYVESDPALSEQTRSKLGGVDADATEFPLHPDRIEEVTDDEVRVTVEKPDETA